LGYRGYLLRCVLLWDWIHHRGLSVARQGWTRAVVHKDFVCIPVAWPGGVW
jgi:hypothetical protein